MIDTTVLWDAFPALRRGLPADPTRRGPPHHLRHRRLQDADREEPGPRGEVHEVFDAYRGNVVGLVEYQKAVPGLDVQKYQDQKVRHYRNRCREMGITPDETLIDQILDPEIDFVVGVEPGGA